MDFDPFDIGARALFDDEGDVDTLRGGIASEVRGRLGKGIAELCHFDRQQLGGLVQGVAVEHRAWVGGGEGAKLVAIHARDVASDADLPEAIERAFVDYEAQRKTFCRRIIFRLCRGDADIGITLAAVVKPQLFLVLRDAVGIVDVTASQKAQHMGG